MPDTITITAVRPALGQTITVTLPEQVVTLLDWVAANVTDHDGSKKYLYGLNVIWQDAISTLVPVWKQAFIDGQLGALRQQIATRVQAVNDAATKQINDGLAGLTVVGP